MKSALFVVVLLVLACGTVCADTVSISCTGSVSCWSAFTFNGNTQASPALNSVGPYAQATPFWDNYSTDTALQSAQNVGCTAGSACYHDMNIGYMLTGTGGFTGTDVLGAQTVTEEAVGLNGSDPTSFLFTPTSNDNVDVTLLGAYSGNSNMQDWGTQFGIYYMVGDTIVYDQLYGPGANAYTDQAALALLDSGETSFGFYGAVCYGGTMVGNYCSEEEMYYSNSAMNSGYVSNTNPSGADYNHFALFQLSDGDWVIGFKDGPVGAEGTGDFQDVVIELSQTDPQSPMPEPATFAVVGVGLIALGVGRRRFFKS